jgi:monoamine oxidase
MLAREHQPMKRTTPRIAIVGAGIAGLAAALTLQDAGFACALFEATDRVGGRMHSDGTTWNDGQVSEWCGEFIDPNHTTLFDLIARFGLDTIELGQANAAPNVLYFNQHYLSMGELAGEAASVSATLHQHWRAAGYPTTYDHFTAEGFRLDHMSVQAWIEQYVAGGYATPLGHFLGSACSGLYGLDPREQSALNLIYLFGSDDPTPLISIARPLQGRHRIVGGNAQLPLAMAHALPQESIHLDHRLVAIARTPDAEVHLTFATERGSLDVACDHVILALPFSTLRQVEYQHAGFDALKQQAIEQLGYGTISKLFVQFDQAYWQMDGPWPHPNSGFIITDLGMQTLWDASIGQPGPRRILVDYTSGSRGAAFAPARPYATTADDTAIGRYAQECVRQLEQVFPGIAAHYTGTAALSYPTRDPHLLGSYSCWRVGQYTLFGGYEGVPQGPIHFAGEHCSVELQGYMEGAAREGIRAAQEIIHDGASS